MKKFALLASVCFLAFAAVPVMAEEEGHHEVTHEDPVADHGAPEGHVAPHLDKPPLKAEAHMDEMSPEEVVEAVEEIMEEAESEEHAEEARMDVSEALAPEAGHPQQAHWDYVGAGGAQYWGGLDESYEACASGMHQSPINIEEYMRDEALGDITLSYQPAPLTVVNNGHTVQVNYTEGSTVQVGDETFELLQFHFHTPSEHYLDGTPYPMEAHFVHKNEAGELGVFGVMMKLGAENPVIQSIWENIPAPGEQTASETVAVNAASLFPADLGYYTYEGSLTTPPCSEGVYWHVLKTPVEISQEQLVAFQSLFPVNARPVQPLHERVVSGK